MENQTTTTKVALKWGIIIGICSVVFSTLIMVLGMVANQAIGFVAYIIIGIGVFMAMSAYKKENNGFMSYGQGLGIGALMAAVSGLLSSAYSFVYMKFIDPSVMDQIFKKAEADMEKKGLSPEQIDQAMEMSKVFMSPGAMFVWGVVGSILLGFVFSLIIAAFVKKDKPIFD
ncbi:DUF4199 domain-containing protein [Flectobacillus roseus]|uniref:DUF4199 domain-containing protein n=1 Tax=Flectobacillus roseus TaxID=502259 RepID=A0ABT6Y5T4_9BACT|nr:DUF4199 domain-containing protein [Flectobacillus roseus]MDI9858925.1 DUF4199 domain-containing protein [Flectobacillus roseus]